MTFYVERIIFDPDYWQHSLFPELQTFYVDCMVPEPVSSDLWFLQYAA